MPRTLAIFVSCFVLLVIEAGSALARNGGTLEAVRARGHLVCGVSNNAPGFSAPDSLGRWIGFDVDLCRALAAAIFLDENRAKFRPLEAGEGETALRQGEIDILTRPTDRTLDLQARRGLDFVGVSFFDAQALLVRKTFGIDSALQMSGARICLVDEPRLRRGLTQFFGQRHMPVQIKAFARQSEAVAAYESRDCDALTEDLSKFPSLRAGLKDPAEHMQLAPLLAVFPRGPVVRLGDETWRVIAQWTLQTMLAAEEAGLSRSSPGKSDQTGSTRLLEVGSELGPQLGLSPGWAAAIIARVGNYGEVFARDLGPGSHAGLDRGLNNLWNAGGLMITSGSW